GPRRSRPSRACTLPPFPTRPNVATGTDRRYGRLRPWDPFACQEGLICVGYPAQRGSVTSAFGLEGSSFAVPLRDRLAEPISKLAVTLLAVDAPQTGIVAFGDAALGVLERLVELRRPSHPSGRR